ncbi:MAG TPA: aldose epimerase family protein [Devosia sp.]|jgi:aldose 1-epimerase|nr:aldose epimerase family protein [Devosia sp.]
MDTYLIANEVLSARLTPFGATLTDLRLSGWPQPLVLGFERIEDYRDTDHYAGAVIGRHANRIARGQVKMSGGVLALPLNGGQSHLHGGVTGTARQNWEVVEEAATSIAFHLVSPDGHEGYPGECAMTARFSITDPATLRLELEATADRETVVNLCHHPYFDFSGHGDVARHHLQIAAETYLPAGPDLVPTGEIAPVANTLYDFRASRPVGHDRPLPGFNNNYCLGAAARSRPTFAARLSLPDGPQMEVWTTQAGLHLYDGYKLQPGQRGLEGRPYGPGQGLCLEAQNWPDSPNHDHFPSAILGANKTYCQVTEYRFVPMR